MTIAYLDASALVKLMLDERESGALRDAIRTVDLVTSEIGSVELHRVARRRELPLDAASRVAESVLMLSADSLVLHEAGQLSPPAMRTLDAIHLATAMRVRGELAMFVCYDQCLAAAAAGHGLPVVAPA